MQTKLRPAIQRHADNHGYSKTGKLAATDIKDIPKDKRPTTATSKKAGK